MINTEYVVVEGGEGQTVLIQSQHLHVAAGCYEVVQGAQLVGVVDCCRGFCCGCCSCCLISL